MLSVANAMGLKKISDIKYSFFFERGNMRVVPACVRQILKLLPHFTKHDFGDFLIPQSPLFYDLIL